MMTVNGSGFVQGSTVYWASTALTTVFEAPTQVSAQVPASLLPLSGKFAITVRNPDGSASAANTSAYVQPVLSALSPASAPAGASGLTITATGIGFSNHSTLVFINPTGGMWLVETTFVNSGKLLAGMPADALVPAGSANVYVQDSTTSTFSNALSFAIAAGSPAISTLVPNTATVGGPTFPLSVSGTAFPSDAVVYFGSIPLSTSFVSATHVTAIVPSTFLNHAGSIAITVAGASGASAAVPFTVTDPVVPAPVVSSLSPASVNAGTPGFVLTVLGSGFVQGSTVLWAGSPLTTTFQSAGALAAQVPAQLTLHSGVADISVNNPTGPAGSSIVPLSVLPVLAAVFPASAAWNGPAFTLTATGAGFGSGIQLRISTPDSRSFTVPTAVSSSTSLTAQMPAAALTAAGTASLTLVANPSGLASTALQFPIVASDPVISSINPASATAGGPAFTLTVTGSNFSPGAVAYWNTTPLNSTVTGSTQLTAQVPASLIANSGVVSITVSAGGKSSNSTSFTIVGPLSISSASPAQIYAEAADVLLTVNGSGFQPGATVQWAGSSLVTTYVSSARLTAAVPKQLQTVPGNYDLTVTNPGGLVSNRWSSIAVYPSLVTIDPASARIPVAGVGITARGGGFNNASVIVFDSSNGRLSLPTTFYSTAMIAAVIPGSALTQSETARLYVLDARTGYTSTAQPFTVQTTAPVITTLAPSSVSAGSPTFVLTVFLDYMGAHPTVKWNGSPLTTVSQFATGVAVSVPAPLVASAGSAEITVESDGRVSASAAFRIINGPTVLTASPAQIDAGGPELTLDIVGTGFVSGSTVYWNGQAIHTAFRGATALSAVAPANLTALTGIGEIRVGNPDGTMSSLPTPSIYIRSVLTSVSPSSAVPGSGDVTLVVKGIGFRPTCRLELFSFTSASPLETTYVDSTTLSAVVPAGRLTAATSATVYVFDTSTRIQSGRLPFTVGTASPVLTRLKPSSARAGDAGFDLTVEGYELRPGTQVRWNGVPLTMVQTGPQWIARVPASLIASPGTAGITLINDDGLVSNSMDFPITGTGAAPTITSLSPNPIPTGGAAAKFIVNGSGFVTGSAVYWNDTPLTTAVLSPSQLEATVPGSLLVTAASIRITVVNPGGATSTAATLTVQAAPPVISSIAPSAFPAGGGSSAMTIHGSGFAAGASVYWNTTALTVTANTSTQLTVQVPATLTASPATALIQVVCGTLKSNTYAAVVYSVVSAPLLTNASPANVDAGGPGFTMTITGESFASGATVYWAGTPLETVFVSAGTLTATVPASLLATSGRIALTVTNPGGAGSFPFAQMFVHPVLSAVAPSSVPAGAAATLEVTGAGFRPTAQVHLIVSGREWTLQTRYLGSTTLSADVLPEHIQDPGTVYVIVTDSADLVFSRSLAMAITGTGPAITSIAPASATAGATEFQLTVNGQNFHAGATVRWDATRLTTTFVSAEQLTASVPSELIAAPGTVHVAVVDPSGAESSTLPFQIVPAAPSILSLSPNSAEAGGPEFVLAVHGAHFAPGAVVRWDDAPLATTVAGSTELTVTVPADRIATPGTPLLVVANQDGQSTPVSFPIRAGGPVIARLDPAETTAGGTSFRLTVTGTGFRPDDAVRWNGTALPTTAASSTEMTALVPEEAIAPAGSGAVTIARSTGGESLAVSFMVNPADPFIRAISPGSATEGAGATTLTILGKGFLPGAVVTWNDQPLETEFADSGRISAQVPAEFVASAGDASLAVANPGGPPAEPRVFVVRPPVAVVSTITPSSATVGGADLTLVADGWGFVTGAAIRWDGVALETAFVDSTRLRAVVPASWIVGVGTAAVSASNPDGPASEATPFPVVEAQPAITGVTPGTVVAGVSGLVLTVDGSGYLPGTTLVWNGVPLETTFVNPTRLTAEVPPELTANSGPARLTAAGQNERTSEPWTVAMLALRVAGFDRERLTVGGEDTTIQVFGDGFQPGATVYWNGTPLSTRLAEGTLTALVPARLIATEGTAAIAVAIPGGLLSNVATLPVTAAAAEEQGQ